MTDIRAVVVDDQRLVRASFAMLLDAHDGIEVVAQAPTGADALDVLPRVGASIVLMDIRMPVMDGIAATRAIRADTRLRDLPVLVLTTFDDEGLVLEALRAGANGFLLKDVDPGVLVEAVRVVASGGSWLDPAVTGIVLARLGESEDDGAEAPDAAEACEERGVARARGPRHEGRGLHEPLTAREEDVLALVCEGLSNRAVGERLFMAESTVKTHVTSLLGKTGTSNRVELIVHAYRVGLADPGAVPLPSGDFPG
ncbi:response regulator transcription factor [Actinomyces sp. B33]|uniref:response regulator transcription factor n=1 Tax=Actinomyces sp. B33 TaxID=2942131 RepID=UPI0023400EF4|nr:response regulator transcription factor [Actinomyces sp. B33]MDC4232401.1 response regulator transcription factor [Actinomyces sp. B33]